MFEFDLVQCGFIVLFLMVAGEIVSHKMKAAIPSILASAILFIALVWSGILPQNVIEKSGLINLTSIAMMFTIIGMGISINVKDLLSNWRVVVLSALTYIGQTLILVLIMSTLFDLNTAIAGIPGGAAVALIVQERARALELNDVIVLSVLFMSVQGLISCPLVSWMIRKETSRFQKEDLFKKISSKQSNEEPVSSTRKPQSPYWSLLRFYLLAWIASRLQHITGLSQYVFCLFLGILFTKLGFLSKDEMEQTKSKGFLTLMMMTMVLSGLSGATPETLLRLCVPLLCILIIDVASIYILSLIIGKFLHFSKPMRFAISLNVMVGFPLNLILAEDLINYLVESPEERNILNQEITAKLIIGGFTSVTFLSTVGAGLLVGLLK